MNYIIHGNNLDWLKCAPSESVDLIYIDPPFNTGQVRTMEPVTARQCAVGGHLGFGDKRYARESTGKVMSYADSFDDYHKFIGERVQEAYRVLKPNGSMFMHLDYREVHYVKVMMDQIFGRSSFINEIIWHYDFGGRSKKKWSAKHDNILWYAKNPKGYTYNYDKIDRIPYLAPGLVGPTKAAKGKCPTDCWWSTIVPTNGKERTGYPTQKPIKVLDRLIRVHTNPGDIVLDFFAGSGTTGEAAANNGCSFIMVDENEKAIEVMTARLAQYEPTVLAFKEVNKCD